MENPILTTNNEVRKLEYTINWLQKMFTGRVADIVVDTNPTVPAPEWNDESKNVNVLLQDPLPFAFGNIRASILNNIYFLCDSFVTKAIFHNFITVNNRKICFIGYQGYNLKMFNDHICPHSRRFTCTSQAKMNRFGWIKHVHHLPFFELQHCLLKEAQVMVTTLLSRCAVIESENMQ